MSAPLTDLEQRPGTPTGELLAAGDHKEGFCRDLFFGRFRERSIMPFPELADEEGRRGDAIIEQVRQFCSRQIDPAAIDRNAAIPEAVIQGLGDLGIFGMSISAEWGGQGMSHQNFCRVMEVLGAHCGSTGMFANAHHSLGMRAMALFGTPEQRGQWLPSLMAGRKIAAFALTETQAGSNAENVRTRAEPAPDGKGFILNGEKRWITNGSIADCVIVFARTPDLAEPDGKITAFLVTRGMPGFEIAEPAMGKTGVRGTVTSRSRFINVYVSRENILGAPGKGLRVALTALDYGRLTMGAMCTGTARFCVDQMVLRARDRIQFGKPIGEFELVQQKIAAAAADHYAIESATVHTAALIDSGASNYGLEAAMLKVFASEQLWRIVNDCMQVWGGAAYFSDLPFERLMRDARLNPVGLGANDVLRSFVATNGLRQLGKELETLQRSALRRPWQAARLLPKRVSIPVKHEHLTWYARQLSRQISALSWAAQMAWIRHREAILDRQFIQARIGDVAIELFSASCVYSRLSSLMVNGTVEEPVKMREFRLGTLYLRLAARRNRERLFDLKSDFDDSVVAVARDLLDDGKSDAR